MAQIDEYYLTDIEKRGVTGGDMASISGLENRKRALIRRAVTSKGSLVHRPDHGGSLKDFQNALLTVANQEKIAVQLAEDWRKDPFVKEVRSVQIDKDADDRITITARIDLIGYGETVLSFKDFNEG